MTLLTRFNFRFRVTFHLRMKFGFISLLTFIFSIRTEQCECVSCSEMSASNLVDLPPSLPVSQNLGHPGRVTRSPMPSQIVFTVKGELEKSKLSQHFQKRDTYVHFVVPNIMYTYYVVLALCSKSCFLLVTVLRSKKPRG